jgi:hypothetical protein
MPNRALRNSRRSATFFAQSGPPLLFRGRPNRTARGGETNNDLPAPGVYVSVLNPFSDLLNLLGFGRSAE